MRLSALEMIEKTTSESYFQAQLAARALSDEIAAPTNAKTLTKALSYLNRRELRRVRRAYQFAEEAHDGQRRLSGHPYVTHPLAVAGVLADMHMDHQTKKFWSNRSGKKLRTLWTAYPSLRPSIRRQPKNMRKIFRRWQWRRHRT